jgi:pimeloyl-ACP methyl ester carboxylesterase
MPELEPLTLRIDHVGPAGLPPMLTLVLLPPAATTAEDYGREGFIDAFSGHGIAVTLLRVETPVDIFAVDRIFAALDAQAPSLAACAAPALWLAGISLGGMTALACAEARRDRVAGVLALAPWPGPRALWDGVPAAGGIAAWAAQQHAHRFDDERRVWRWLGEGAAGGPEVHIGYGRDDRFAPGQQLMCDALHADRRRVVDGGHDWPTWRTLWRQAIAQLAPRLAARAPGGDSAVKPG